MWRDLPLSDLPGVNDILWCRIPHPQKSAVLPADPPHPVIVRCIDRNDKLNQATLYCIYGTSKIKDREHLDLVLQMPSEFRLHGLREPTRFDLANTHTIPCFWAFEFFPNRRKIGTLTGACITRMKAKLKERDITWVPPPLISWFLSELCRRFFLYLCLCNLRQLRLKRRLVLIASETAGDRREVVLQWRTVLIPLRLRSRHRTMPSWLLAGGREARRGLVYRFLVSYRPTCQLCRLA